MQFSDNCDTTLTIYMFYIMTFYLFVDYKQWQTHAFNKRTLLITKLVYLIQIIYSKFA